MDGFSWDHCTEGQTEAQREVRSQPGSGRKALVISTQSGASVWSIGYLPQAGDGEARRTVIWPPSPESFPWPTPSTTNVKNGLRVPLTHCMVIKAKNLLLSCCKEPQRPSVRSLHQSKDPLSNLSDSCPSSWHTSCNGELTTLKGSLFHCRQLLLVGPAWPFCASQLLELTHPVEPRTVLMSAPTLQPAFSPA